MLLALFTALASCSGRPDYRLLEGTLKNPGQTAPLVVVQSIEGMPPAASAALFAALSAAARDRDINIAGASLRDGGYMLTGIFRTLPDSASVRVAYQWQLRDGRGAPVHAFNGHENAGLFTGADPWDAVTPTVMQRIALTTVDVLATRLGQLGYSTRVAELDRPPPDYFVPAGTGAEREVDMALLDGTAEPDPSLDGLGPEMDVTNGNAYLPADPLPEEAMPGQEPQVAEAPVSNPDKTDLEDPEGKFQIRAVAVLPVRGAGEGGDELTLAMKRTLEAAGWPVVSEPQPDAITVVGLVRVSDPESGQQNVSLRWEVKTPGGGQLGDVKQSNRIPAGTLDHGWGDAAVAVTEAAAVGIFDIVQRFQ